MNFIDSFKRLEKLCSELYGNKHGISFYIDEMKGIADGEERVSGWNADLKKLKHCRWVRNKIVHEPGCTEENMCGPDDSRWLQDFHSRIMSKKDPLSMYRKGKKQNSGNVVLYLILCFMGIAALLVYACLF